jgi:AAA domain
MKAIEGQTWKLFEQEFLPLGKTYDYVIFDCPPGISPLSETAVRASDLIIVPTIPDFVSVFGLKQYLLESAVWKFSTTEAIAARPCHQVPKRPSNNTKTTLNGWKPQPKSRFRMAIDIDGLAVLHAIAENPLAFPDVVAELKKVALRSSRSNLRPKRRLSKASDIFIPQSAARPLSLSSTICVTLAALLSSKDSISIRTIRNSRPRSLLCPANGLPISAVPAKKPPKPVPAKKASKLATAKKAPKPAQSPEQKALGRGAQPKRQIWPRRATFGASTAPQASRLSRRPGRKTDSGSCQETRHR